tara:strand:- start:157 stop:3882 length:3726 start_codon:yes stop_codon:yes gene_type:complete
MSKDLYKIKDYSDAELYEILDLNNPTDRELEAKILMMIHKYENSKAKSSKKLVKFFEDIYEHFFDDSDEELYEDFTDRKLTDEQKAENDALNTTLDELKEKGLIDYDVTLNELSEDSFNELIETKKLMDAEMAADPNAYNPTKQYIPQTDNIDKDTTTDAQSNEVYTKEVPYAGGTLNPILKQTKKRVISIDSQYRADKRTFPTEFTFDLSEPLKDVVSLKLYSVQIPFTWYTIAKTYGSNFFYIKGNAPGIQDNPNHDIQIDLSAGNYTPIELANNLNSAIARQADIYSDTNFNTTDVSYNKFTSLTTVTCDIDKTYNENSYYIEFPVTGIDDLSLSPYLKDASRNITIPAYLGLQTQTYYPNVIKTLPEPEPSASDEFFVSSGNTANSDVLQNNFFSVYKYISKNDFDINDTSIIEVSFDISMTLVADASYTRQEIVADISSQLLNNYYLSDSYLKRTNVSSYNDSTDSFYELKIKPNRFRTQNIANSKVAIVFPPNSSNTNMWYGTDSCFRFDKQINEINDIISEKPAIVQNDVFIQKATERNDVLMVNFTASQPAFQLDPSVNDLSFSVLYTDSGYSTTEFISAINNSIKNLPNSSTFNYDSENESLNFNEITQDPSGTYAYIDTNDRFNFNFDIVKDISFNNYEIDLNGSIIEDNIGKGHTEQTNEKLGELFVSANDPLLTIQDFNKIYLFSTNSNSRDIDINKPIFTVKTRTDAFEIKALSDLSDSYTVGYTDTDIQPGNYTVWQQKINEQIASFKDPSNNLPLFTTTQGLDDAGNPAYFGPRLSNPNDDNEIGFNIMINKKLTAVNYNIQLMDVSSGLVSRDADFNADNTWRDTLIMDAELCYTSLTDTKYDLFQGIPDEGNTKSLPDEGNIKNLVNSTSETIGSVDASGAIVLSATEILPVSNVITITTGKNDTINIIAQDDGVYSSGGENNITLTIPTGAYTRASLLIAMNEALTNNTNTTTQLSGKFELVSRNNKNYLNINLTILRKYLPNDFKIVFYDEFSFAKCSAGFSSVKNTTWDSTLGWVLGFREYTVYDLKAIGLTTETNAMKVIGDTGVSTQLYNYFLLCLDDFNQNHLNDGLVTITNQDTSVPLPSYANRSDFQCDPVSGEIVYNTSSGLTEKQMYSALEIYNSKNVSTSIGTSVSSKSYGSGPFVKDVFGIVPLKVSNLVSGSAYTEFGGTLQNQERNYFGPVNIRRMSVSLRTDRGDLVDLNNANWSFSLIAEQLNKNPNE